ncbi:unnamed protein product [Diamesa serratosioi]
MKTANFHSILFNDVFHEIKQYLSLDDLYSLRRVSIEIRYFVDTEVNSLTDINLSGSSNCSFQAFNYITSHCKNIVNINLNRCAWLTNELLETIVLKNYKTLQSISLGCCSKLNSNALQPVIINCKKLKKLGLSNNYWLTSGCVTSIAFHLKNLQELDLKSCPILSDDDDQKMAIMRKAFQMFDTTKSGFIETIKITTILNTMGQLFDEGELQALIDEQDQENVGKVNFDGFCNIAAHFLEEEDDEAMQQELKEAFRLYDREGNGYITTSTLKEILGALDDKLTSSDLDSIITEIDTDGSGTVDFDEFMEMMTGD